MSFVATVRINLISHLQHSSSAADCLWHRYLRLCDWVSSGAGCAKIRESILVFGVFRVKLFIAGQMVYAVYQNELHVELYAVNAMINGASQKLTSFTAIAPLNPKETDAWIIDVARTPTMAVLRPMLHGLHR